MATAVDKVVAESAAPVAGTALPLPTGRVLGTTVRSGHHSQAPPLLLPLAWVCGGLIRRTQLALRRQLLNGGRFRPALRPQARLMQLSMFKWAARCRVTSRHFTPFSALR